MKAKSVKEPEAQPVVIVLSSLARKSAAMDKARRASRLPEDSEDES